MAPFTHVNPKGSRFSDGSFGAYYAADRLETAIRETAHHFVRFARDAADPPRRETMRVLVGAVDRDLHDVATLAWPERSRVLDPDDYGPGRALARRLREEGADGLVYPSVRDPAGTCVAVFWPDAVAIPRQERHLVYDWDGRRVRRYFDYAEDAWMPIAPASRLD